MVRKIILSLLLATPFVCFADLNDNLNKFYNKFDSSGNLSSGDVYNGQRCGYMTGGGLSIRNRVMNEKVGTISMPKFEAGCGGIDIYAGGMSFINGKQIVSQLKSVASSASGYAFLLGLESLSPQSSNVMKQLQSWANQINGIGINSCETASAMVGSVWPKETLAKQEICRGVAGKSGYMSDRIAGRQQCSNEGTYNDTMRKFEEDNPLILKEEFNLSWEAINRHGGCKSNVEKEIFMSLMGTVIAKKDETGKIKKEIIPSKINDDSFLLALLNGGKVNMLACSGKNEHEKCLVVQTFEQTVSHEISWIGKIETQLNNIQFCVLNDTKLEENDKNLLAKSRLPLYKIVNALTAYKKGYCPVELFQVANIVGMDMLMQYLREVIEVTRTGCRQLKATGAYSSEIDDYLKNLSSVERKIEQHEIHNRDLLIQEQHLIRLVEKIEQQLSSELIIR